MSSKSNSNIQSASERIRLRVLFDFEYETRGRQITIKKNETLHLISKTNEDWWQVVRPSELTQNQNFYVPEQSTFFVPTGYVSEMQEELLPGSTKFYVDKEKMFAQENEEEKAIQETGNNDVSARKGNDSFRNAIKKFSGSHVSNDSKPNKTSKSSRIIKVLRKNSVEVGDLNNKAANNNSTKSTGETSTFGMCFGRDMKNAESKLQNPFQEELQHAIVNRSHKKVNIENYMKPSENESETKVMPNTSSVELAKEKWENSFVKLKKRNFQVSPKAEKTTIQKQLPRGKGELYSVVEKNDKKLLFITEDKVDVKINLEKKEQSFAENELEIKEETVNEDNNKNIELLNDKRKMWAIETLLSELMQSSNTGKTSEIENNNKDISGPNQLAQELHEISVSRNAETQVNLLDMENNTKENKIFDFSMNWVDTASTKVSKSPKQFDEYNEANILNDRVDANDKIIAEETPSYSNVSLHLKRGKIPSKLKIPTLDFREELQLTSSLEKLASEIQFLPSCRKSAENGKSKNRTFEKEVADSTIASLSNDSLRLYKRRSKSDGALNRKDISDSGQSDVINYQIITKERSERKYAQNESRNTRHDSCQPNVRRIKLSSVGRSDRVHSASKYKLCRKSKSLGDLDSSEIDSEREVTVHNVNLKRRYKPVPKLRSKDSFKKIKSPPPSPVTQSNNYLLTKPVPAKRRIFTSPLALPECGRYSSDSGEEFTDIERRTAIGFKALLRTPESGSEEFLHYKTFPKKNSPDKNFEAGIFCSDGNVNLSGKATALTLNPQSNSRSLSEELILNTSTSTSGGMKTVIEDNWTTCSSPANENSIENLDLPAGWIQSYDLLAKRICYVNQRGDKWFSSSDADGKIYFFEENSNESSWALPPVLHSNRLKTISNDDWPQLFDGNMYIIKEGPINKTKITSENGKRLRKNWSSSYAVLTELFLLFFKDAKTFAAMKVDRSAAAKPDISVDLNGAFIESADKISNRKNVYLISTLLGLQILIQWDNATITAEWYQAIHNAIKKLPFSQESVRNLTLRGD